MSVSSSANRIRFMPFAPPPRPPRGPSSARMFNRVLPIGNARLRESAGSGQSHGRDAVCLSYFVRGRDLRSDYWDRPAFETIRPRRLTAPPVFNSGHSGRDYPERFLEMTRLDPLAIRQSEDAWVDELFSRAPHLGTPLLRAHFPRAYLAVNRQ